MLALFAVTITFGAFLLFLIQPMIAKMIMPHLGGAPTVWNTAMLFFQACLLAGYAYAHAAAKYLNIRRHAVLHGLLLMLSLLALPLALYVPDIDASHEPIGWALMALAVSVGFPFLMLSSTAPLLQHWFAHSGHRLAANPYPMYSASNAGSLIALFAFPLVVDPFLPVSQQTLGWSIIYGLYMLLIGVCMWRIYPKGQSASEVVQEKYAAPRVTGRERLHWILLAAVPSSLMLGVTTFISTDIASVPLIWIMPLALYLLTFVFAFGDARNLYLICRRMYLPTLLLMLVLTISNKDLNIGVMGAHLFGFFVLAMMCHGRLNECKPHVSQLTQFYLCMAVGGVLGGLINGMVAPLLFDDVYEYPIVLIVAALLYPLYRYQELHRPRLILLSLFAVILLCYYSADEYIANLPVYDVPNDGVGQAISLDLIIYLVCVFVGFLMLRKSRAGFVGMLFLLYGAHLVDAHDDVLFRDRNFFGVSLVLHLKDENARGYIHGTALHGLQSLAHESKLQPVAYYAALREVIDNLPMQLSRAPLAAVGMGMGTVQCYAQPDQHYDYFEIDPVVKRIATDPALFSYLTDCPGSYSIYLGDGRVEIEKMGNGRYAMIVLDAYSSDSLPVHLINKQAVATYQSKLKMGGLLAFHVTNRHMNLKPILANVGHALGLNVYYKEFESHEQLIYPSSWIIMSHDEHTIAGIVERKSGWVRLQPNGMRLWEDDYSNILQALTLTQGWFMKAAKGFQ
jgi:hypothetical protein